RLCRERNSLIRSSSLSLCKQSRWIEIGNEQPHGLAIAYVPMLRDDDRAIHACYADLDEGHNVTVLGSETEVSQTAEVERGGNARQQRNVLLLVEGPAPGELGRHEQLEILGETILEARDLAARAAVVEAANELSRTLRLR